MGVDSRGVYRGGCTHPGCTCREFQRSSGASKCYVCSHPPANHIDKALPQQPVANNGKHTRPTPVAPPVEYSKLYYSVHILAGGLSVALEGREVESEKPN